MFAWCFGHGFLPTNVKLSFIKSYMDLAYSGGDETVLHALRVCPKARDVLIASSFDNRLLINQHHFCINWIEDSMHILEKKAFEDVISTLWNIWNSRNNAIFKGNEEDAGVIWERARKLNDDFRIHNFSSQPVLPKVPRSFKWEKPSEGAIKVNMDASVKAHGT
ncbi:Polynucleotidyl transferase, Ribonuclease H fold [Gossypium australe]|uniref:Polynucleotidyl transferase, Ribonuclease H fold n=1 Tax=Gossypium australe TaxID=47621 RepID=A0A5B6X192_9ROSI|nr:Polynucleotidyl transferase, Ribonuclease H fold [Gossypium australe]